VPLPIPEPRESGFTRTTGVPLYWAAYGVTGAPKVLVLHGGPGADHRYLLPQMLRLADRFDVLFYDQRGGGQSRTDSVEPITWRTQVADLGAVVREFGLALPTIVGYSWGGFLAMLYAAETLTDPTLLHAGRLALIDPAPVTREYRAVFEEEFRRRGATDLIRAARAELAASGARESDPAAYRQRAFELSVAGYFVDPREAKDLTPFRVVGRVQRSVWDSVNGYDLLPALARLRARFGTPTLVLHGREDPIPLASSAAVAETLGAELVIIEGSGHVPFVERPDTLFPALDRFLTPILPLAPHP
jgi:proline iminopeptidase